MIENKIQININLAPMTTFKIGGPARYFVIIENKEELVDAFAWANKNNIKCSILGGGSNLLVNDRGVDALVMKIKTKGIFSKGDLIEAAAGEDLAKLISFATSNSLTGLEWAAGIPGTVGGAIRGNAGAFGSSISEAIEWVESYNLSASEFQKFNQRACRFDYRQSIFNNNNLIIWSGVFKFKPGKKQEIKKEIENNIKYRNIKQPKLPSAGSVFKNVTYENILENNPGLAELADKDRVVKGNKVGSGWIIDQAGLKGKKIGGAKVSLEHGNFIVNTGNASAEDVIMLISFIKQQVRNKLNIQLNEEIEYFGY